MGPALKRTVENGDIADGTAAAAFTQSAADVLEHLGAARETGLRDREVARRRRRYGRNMLRRPTRKSFLRILLDQFNSVVLWLLLAAAGLSFAFAEWMQAGAILIVIALNTAIGSVTELKATRSMEALRRIGRVSTRVRRNGAVKEIPAQNLVPGDIVLLEGGDVVTADLRLIEASKLQCDESALTGESVPVSKSIDVLSADTSLADRTNMAFKASSVVRGSGEGVVVSIGMATELGRISSLMEATEDTRSPLESRLDRLGQNLMWLTLVLAVLISIAGVMAGKDIVLMVQTGVALAVAAVPEGLPVVTTIALARGLWRLARRNALIERLAAVESLGATTVIMTDKTGTLTENRMTVTTIVCDSGETTVRRGGEGSRETSAFVRDGAAVEAATDPSLRRTLEVAALCNNAFLPAQGADEDGVGDPLEVALLVAAAIGGIDRPVLLQKWPETREEAFDPANAMMATVHRDGAAYLVAVKGAPEAVIAACTHVMTQSGTVEMTEDRRRAWRAKNDDLAANGQRLLAVACKAADRDDDAPYANLTLVGLIGMLDPPRTDVADAIRACKEAGLRIIMVTGDQAPTAVAVAVATGLVSDPDVEVVDGRDLKDLDRLTADQRVRLLSTKIFARVSPKQKLDLMDLVQSEGAIVAMTGDGVNDAPALKSADIGIAMGQRGTEVAREAADMVLRDDSFASIVAAVEQGRAIFDNIRKFVIYLLSCNISEILIVSVASLTAMPLPLLPLQILYLNLITDIFPAFALGVGEGTRDIMKRPPRDPKERIVMRDHWLVICIYGVLITLCVFGAYILAFEWLDASDREAVTVSFLTLAFAQLWHVFNIRAAGRGLFRNEVVQNPYIWGALVLCAGLLLAAVETPVVAEVLELTTPRPGAWLLVIGFSVLPVVLGSAARKVLPDRAFP